MIPLSDPLSPVLFEPSENMSRRYDRDCGIGRVIPGFGL